MFSTKEPNYHLQDNSIDVWLCQADSLQDRLDYFLSLLSSEEASRAERFKFNIHRNRFIISHGFMRSVLAKYLNIEPSDIKYQKTEMGKPFLIEEDNTPALKFNLSHTQDIALLAVTRKAQVGLDIEYMERKTDWQGICKRFFTQAEQDILFALAETKQSQAFFQLWTRKEAYMKVLGTGLSLSPTKFTLTVPPEKPALIQHHSKKYQQLEQLEFLDIDLPESLNHYCATLAAETSIHECHGYFFRLY